MKRNKIMKKVLAMAGMAAVVLALGGVRVAEAAWCTHKNHAERPISVGSSQWTSSHTIQVYKNGNVVYETCTILHQGYMMQEYCLDCGYEIGTHSFVDYIHTHSSCPYYEWK